MSSIYILEHGSKISFRENQINIDYKNGTNCKVPIEMLEDINIFGRVQMTEQCTVECLVRGIPVAYYSTNGKYHGRLESLNHVNVERQRMQAGLNNTDFAINLSKQIIKGKIKNQLVVLQRYARSKQLGISAFMNQIKFCREKIDTCDSIAQIMGYEGIAARIYFEALALLVDEEFKFRGRSKRPPKDEFNALLSLGYSIVMNEIFTKIVQKGLNPYFGFLHQDKPKHATLASDLLEEWRSILVDSLVLKMINGHEILKEHFYRGEDGGFYLNKEGMSIFISAIDKKMKTVVKYFDDCAEADFRRGIEIQVMKLVHAMQAGDALIYKPVEIR